MATPVPISIDSSGGPVGDLTSLSKRETQVLAVTALGLTNRQAAAELGVSVHAVKFHLAAVYRKLGVANRTQAVAMFVTANPKFHD